MNRPALFSGLQTVQPRLLTLLGAVAFCALVSGCRVYPEPNRRTIDELYFEALNASKLTPEHTLGLNPSPAGDESGTLLPPIDQFDSLRDEGSARRSSEAVAPTKPDQQTDQKQPPVFVPPVEHAEPPQLMLPPAEQSQTSVWRKRPAPEVRTVSYGKSDSRVQRISARVRGNERLVVSEIFEDTDVRQALQVLASQAGVTIIVDEQISGTITTLIEEVPFEAALRKVLLPLGLVYRRTDDGEYIVAVPDPSSALFSRVSERLEYRPMHVSPDELLRLLSARDAKFVTVIDKRNLMLIEAPTEIAEPILRQLQKSDNPIPQVELEAIVCVIAPDRGFKSGLDWNHAVTLNGSEVFRMGMAGLAINGSGSGQGANSAFSNFAVTAAFVKLLAQEGYLSIRAAPRVTARDGEPARIAITRQSFFSTQPNSDNAFFRQELEQVEAGITMEITPIIRGDNITVKIEKAEVSEDIRTTDVNAAVANNPFPTINRRTVSTTVNVRNSETIVIGGLVQRQTVDRISRVPVLGDIPYAGRLFQTVEQMEQDAEVVIFISPRIVTSGPDCSLVAGETFAGETFAGETFAGETFAGETLPENMESSEVVE